MPRGEGHPARGAKHHLDPRPAHRRPHHPPPRLRGLPASASGSRRASAGRRRSPGSPTSSCAVWPRSTVPSSSASPPTTWCGCRTPAEAPGGGLAVSAPMGCRPVGRWRIVAADIWERDYLDLCGPAMLDIRADGHGKSASTPSRPASTSPTAIRSSFDGRGSTRWTRSEAPGRPNSSKTAPWRSLSAITATTLSSKPNAQLLQQPAKGTSGGLPSPSSRRLPRMVTRCTETRAPFCSTRR